MTLPVILAIAGCAALLAGLFGGGVKAKEIVIPKLSTLPRILSSLAGLVLIGVAIRVSSIPIPSTEVVPTQIPLTEVTFTQISPTEVPVTQVPPTVTSTEQPHTPSAMVPIFPAQADSKSQAVFIHSVLSGNMSGSFSDIENNFSSDPRMLIFAMSNFNSPVNDVGVRNKHLVAVWYRGTQWSITNQDMGFMPQDAAFNIQILSESDNAFIQTATSANISNSWTVIDHPLAFDPNALVFAQPTWSPSGRRAKENIHPLGVWYTGSQWAILNLDGAPMREGAAFNVQILDESDRVFIHTTTTSNTEKNWTLIDSPLAYDVNKLVFVMPRGLPDNKEVNNVHPLGVWYSGSQWAIFNQNESDVMPLGTAFNILILDEK